MSNRLSQSFNTVATLAMVALALLGGATRAEALMASSTGRVISRAEMRSQLPGAALGENAYAEVNSAWLLKWYPTFRDKLFKIGIVKWDERFDCNRFAAFYTDLAQASFASEAFHSRSPAQALALGTFWYQRANGQGAHAIIQAMTERGRIFIDPQSGQEVHLTNGEVQSGYVQVI